jgi:hypothetical protein
VLHALLSDSASTRPCGLSLYRADPATIKRLSDELAAAFELGGGRADAMFDRLWDAMLPSTAGIAELERSGFAVPRTLRGDLVPFAQTPVDAHAGVGGVLQCLVTRVRVAGFRRSSYAAEVSLANPVQILTAKVVSFRLGRVLEVSCANKVVAEIRSDITGCKYECEPAPNRSRFFRARLLTPTNPRAVVAVGEGAQEPRVIGRASFKMKLWGGSPRVVRCEVGGGGLPHASVHPEGQAEGGARVLRLANRRPWWNPGLGAFVLNFSGRVTRPSVKNVSVPPRPASFSAKRTASLLRFQRYPVRLHQTRSRCSVALRPTVFRAAPLLLPRVTQSPRRACIA